MALSLSTPKMDEETLVTLPIISFLIKLPINLYVLTVESVRCVIDWPFFLHLAIVTLITWTAGLRASSFFLVLLCATLYLKSVYDVQIKRITIRIRRTLELEYARSKPCTDAETLTWLSSLLDTMWPTWMELSLSQSIAESVQASLDTAKPQALKSLVLEDFRLGSSPPIIRTAKVYRAVADTGKGNGTSMPSSAPNTGESAASPLFDIAQPETLPDEHAVLELDLEFVAAEDMSILLAATMKRMGIVVKMFVSDFQISGRLRLGMQFIPEHPYVRTLKLSFVESPNLRISARPMSKGGMDVMDLPMVSDFVQKAVKEMFEGMMVAPLSLDFDMVEMMGAGEAAQANGGAGGDGKSKKPVVSLEILEGSHLVAKDKNGKSDPYVVIRLGKRRVKTSVKKVTLSPKWHEVFQLPISLSNTGQSLEGASAQGASPAAGASRDNLHNNNNFSKNTKHKPPYVIRMTVFDHDAFSKDDPMGKCQVDLSQYADGKRTEMWLPLTGVHTGKLRVAVTVHNWPQQQQQGEAEASEQPAAGTVGAAAGGGAVSVQVGEGMSLASASVTSTRSTSSGGTSDTFSDLQLGSTISNMSSMSENLMDASFAHSSSVIEKELDEVDDEDAEQDEEEEEDIPTDAVGCAGGGSKRRKKKGGKGQDRGGGVPWSLTMYKKSSRTVVGDSETTSSVKSWSKSSVCSDEGIDSPKGSEKRSRHRSSRIGDDRGEGERSLSKSLLSMAGIVAEVEEVEEIDGKGGEKRGKRSTFKVSGLRLRKKSGKEKGKEGKNETQGCSDDSEEEEEEVEEVVNDTRAEFLAKLRASGRAIQEAADEEEEDEFLEGVGAMGRGRGSKYGISGVGSSILNTLKSSRSLLTKNKEAGRMDDDFQ